MISRDGVENKIKGLCCDSHALGFVRQHKVVSTDLPESESQNSPSSCRSEICEITFTLPPSPCAGRWRLPSQCCALPWQASPEAKLYYLGKKLYKAHIVQWWSKASLTPICPRPPIPTIPTLFPPSRQPQWLRGEYIVIPALQSEKLISKSCYGYDDKGNYLPAQKMGPAFSNG